MEVSSKMSFDTYYHKTYILFIVPPDPSKNDQITILISRNALLLKYCKQGRQVYQSFYSITI